MKHFILPLSGMRKEATNRYKDVEIQGPDAAKELIPELFSLGLASPIGEVIAHATKGVPDKNRRKELKGYSYATLIPGVGSARDAERDMYVDNYLSKGKNVHTSALAERLGGLSSAILLGALSGIIGAGAAALTGRDSNTAWNRGVYGGLGGFVAGLLADSVGNMQGHLTGARSDQEHANYLNNSSALAQYLVPGLAGYNWGRRNVKKGLASQGL